MKLNRPLLAIAVMTVCAVVAGSAFASGCPDDPERCVERGATLKHSAVTVAPATVVTSAPAHVATVTAVAHKAQGPVVAPKSKQASKATRVSPTAPAPATPGMGMLLKLSNGAGGEVSLFPSKANDNATGASWVL